MGMFEGGLLAACLLEVGSYQLLRQQLPVRLAA